MVVAPFHAPSFLLRHKNFLCILATAVLWWLAGQRAGWFALGWIALAPLFFALSEIPSARARFWFGWRAGWMCFALLNWWILPAIVRGGEVIGVSHGVGALLGVLAVGLIGIIHGFGVAVISILWNPRANIFQRAPLLLPLVIALAWWAFEAARCESPLAHAWGAFAFTQWRDVALLQNAFWLGQHGLSALCVWMAVSLALWLRPEYSTRVPNLWRAPLLVFFMLHAWGAWRIWDYDRKPSGRVMRVLLVQTNVSSLRKNRDTGESHFEQATRLTRKHFAKFRVQEFRPPEPTSRTLVVWPETTAAVAHIEARRDLVREGERGRHLRAIEKLAREHDSAILFGAHATRVWESAEYLDGNKYPIANEAVLVEPSGRAQSYAKIRVVPFGERAPGGEYFSFLNHFAPDPPVSPGAFAEPLKLGDVSIGALICFESCFSRPAKTMKAKSARAFFVLTNDEWCSGTNAPWEHAAMSALRAVENDAPAAQSANGGHTFAIDARGRFLQILPFGQTGVLDARLPVR